MIVRKKSAYFIYLPETPNNIEELTESAEWLNLANVVRAYEVEGGRMFVQFIDSSDSLYCGIQADKIKEELNRICSEQL